MNKKSIILLKAAMVVLLTILLVWLINLDQNTWQKKQPEGAMVRAQEAGILTKELAGAFGENLRQDFAAFWEQGGFGENNSLTYTQYRSLLEFMAQGIPGGLKESDIWEKITYENRYREEFFLTREDWYQAYDRLLSFYSLEKEIRREQLEILCGNENLVKKEQLEEGSLLDADTNRLSYEDPAFKDAGFAVSTVYRTDSRLLTLLEMGTETVELPGVLAMEAGEEGIYFFYKGYEIVYSDPSGSQAVVSGREQITDLYFSAGCLTGAEVFDERISGKLLGVSSDSIELEGYGCLEMAKDCAGYRVYEELGTAAVSELAIGYNFADFVIKDGKIRGFLVLRKEQMETIRVALQGSGYTGIYHDRIALSCTDSDMTVSYGTYEERKQERIPKGETLIIEDGSKYLSGDRIRVEPMINSAKICVESLQRSQGTSSYRGRMEIMEAEEGMALINELLLEEYLYSVVPSEMPASYPAEALMTQAVCARTYAYQYLEQPGYGSLGAHVDDSVSYQVYNNIEENINTTRAVRETSGLILTYAGEPVSAYYYSTSCGFGTDAGVWSDENKESMPYLNAVSIIREDAGADSGEAEQKESGEAFTPQSIQEEKNFREYLTEAGEQAWEKEEPWYRWEYEVSKIDAKVLSDRLTARYRAAPGKILFYTGTEENYEEEDFIQKEPKAFKQVLDIQCMERGEGGVMHVLLLKTDQGSYKILSEYNIRYILNLGGPVLRQDGSRYESSALLPSAYMIIDLVKSGKNVIGYTILGGGYGHGVGMSQNGAKAMAQAGKTGEEILLFFYKGCEIGKIY